MPLTELIELYAAFIETTYPRDLTDEQTIANCALSWIGELNEWWEVVEDWAGRKGQSEPELYEAGDVLYYMVKLLSTLGCDLAILMATQPPDKYTSRTDVDQIVRTLTDSTKKHLYYRPERYDREGYADKVEYAAQKTLDIICEGWTLDQIIKGNINKLATRYNVPNPLEVSNESH